MGRVMAIDFGTRRIGVALSDVLRLTAHGYETVSWNGVDSDYAIDRIVSIIRDKEVTEIVIGRPRRTDNQVSDSQRKAENFGDLLAEASGIKPTFMDERYTTVIATRFLQDTGVAGKDRKKVVDQVAAEIILREHLETHRRQS
jgi:putative Holliday junction resolvase